MSYLPAHESEHPTVTEPMDLIHLTDPEGNRCVVRVAGRFRPGVLTGHDVLRADVSVSADFVDARLRLLLLPRDVDSWARALACLGPGRSAGLGGDRGVRLGIHVYEDGGLSMQIDDPDRLTAVLGARPEGDWITEHRERVEEVRRTWPREVLETAPGTYEWSPGRAR